MWVLSSFYVKIHTKSKVFSLSMYVKIYLFMLFSAKWFLLSASKHSSTDHSVPRFTELLIKLLLDGSYKIPYSEYPTSLFSTVNCVDSATFSGAVDVDLSVLSVFASHHNVVFKIAVSHVKLSVVLRAWNSDLLHPLVSMLIPLLSEIARRQPKCCK